MTTCIYFTPHVFDKSLNNHVIETILASFTSLTELSLHFPRVPNCGRFMGEGVFVYFCIFSYLFVYMYYSGLKCLKLDKNQTELGRY
jgi:hypothetical protein